MLDRFQGALLGLACGDATGTTVEFKSRGSFPTVTNMVGGGVFKLQPGQWTDDTSMAMCLAESLLKHKGFNTNDQMQQYLKWQDTGYWSSNGRCFDIGSQTSSALFHFKKTGKLNKNSQASGNGGIMRLAPVPMFFYSQPTKIAGMSGKSSQTTHQSVECIEAARLFGKMIHLGLSGATKNEILLSHKDSKFKSIGIQNIASGKYFGKQEIEIFGTGYVVQSLEAALWCFHTTSNYRDAVLKATNLGDDADTTAAICGQLAGAFYGRSGIPENWLKLLARHDEILNLANKLYLLNV